MLRVFAIAASLLQTAVLVASGTQARRDLVPIIRISAIFDLAPQTRRKADHTCDH
jgi:hypothetical protein